MHNYFTVVTKNPIQSLQFGSVGGTVKCGDGRAMMEKCSDGSAAMEKCRDGSFLVSKVQCRYGIILELSRNYLMKQDGEYKN